MRVKRRSYNYILKIFLLVKKRNFLQCFTYITAVKFHCEIYQPSAFTKPMIIPYIFISVDFK